MPQRNAKTREDVNAIAESIRKQQRQNKRNRARLRKNAQYGNYIVAGTQLPARSVVARYPVVLKRCVNNLRPNNYANAHYQIDSGRKDRKGRDLCYFVDWERVSEVRPIGKKGDTVPFTGPFANTSKRQKNNARFDYMSSSRVTKACPRVNCKTEFSLYTTAPIKKGRQTFLDYGERHDAFGRS